MKYKVISYSVALLLFFHLFMTFIYLGPPNLLQVRIGLFSFRYMNQVFYQNWHLFSPEPGFSTTKLAVRCADPNQNWTEWKDPLAGALALHHLTRISGYGKELMLFNEIPELLKIELENKKDRACKEFNCVNPVDVTELYAETPKRLATRFATDYCRAKHPQRPDKLGFIQFKVLEFFPLSYTKSQASDASWESVSEIKFEPVSVNHERNQAS